MSNSYHEALNKLLKAQQSLAGRDLSKLPRAQQADLEKSKAAIYAEIQALQSGEMSDLDGNYESVTNEFNTCKTSLQNLSDWLGKQKQQAGDDLNLISKGIGLALSLFA